MTQKIVLYYNDLVFRPSEAFLFKDFGQVPFVMSEIYHTDLEYWISATLLSNTFEKFRGKRVRQFAKRHDFLPRRFDLFKNIDLYRSISREEGVTHLVMFPFTPLTDLVFARCVARQGIKIILKLDANQEYLTHLENDWRRNRRYPNRILRQSYHYRNLLQLAALIICETSECEAILLNKFLDLDLSAKLIKTFSGVSESWLASNGITQEPVVNRRNAIIVSGRISSRQKHSELIFQAGPPPEGWTIEFVGEVDNEMKQLIERYRALDPKFDDHYRFHGIINDKRTYFKLLSQAKALLMNSRGGEGFPNVYAEAHFCRLFIVTSNVSGAQDATDRGRYGLVYERDDALALRSALAKTPDLVAATHGMPASDDHRRRFIWEYSLDHPALTRLFAPTADMSLKTSQ